MFPTLFVAMLATGTIASPPQDTLRDQVRKLGAVEVLYIRDLPPTDLKTLVRDAELIARVLVVESKTSLIGDRVLTDYKAQVLAVTKGTLNVEGTTITIRRPGGKLVLEEGTVTARDPEFPAFQGGEEYLLFLKPTNEGFYEVRFGGQGAFKVEQGKVAQVSDVGNWNRERGRVDLGELLRQVAAATKN